MSAGPVFFYQDVRRWLARLRRLRQRSVITDPRGRLAPSADRPCALLVVGRNFDQRKPDAMMTCRLGYARAFEAMGLPYLLCDWRRLPETVARLPQALAIVFGSDVAEMDRRALAALRLIPSCVWVNPWFDGELAFFQKHGLEAGIWVWPQAHRAAILGFRPKFAYTATVPSGLNFFAGWAAAGLPVRSLPLACDTSLYTPEGPEDPDFADVDLAFVGGYWESKGRALDRYLRPFEPQLRVYGYNRWPYAGYCGQLVREREPALYRQAKVCPVVNEPTVAMLKGQINERIFKVFGSGGAPVVDAVPAYRELFTPDELEIPADEVEFAAQVRTLLTDPERRLVVAARGRAAVLARHTYGHRAREILAGLGVDLAGLSALA